MPYRARHSTSQASRGGRDRMVSVAAGVLVLTGAAGITRGLTEQNGPPQPSVSAAGIVDGSAPVAPSPTHTSPTLSATRASAPSATRSPSTRPSSARPRATVLALPRSKPVSLSIPAIGLSSTLGTVGLNRDHTIEVPSGSHYDQAAWYRFSPTPGASGPAVIVGHVDRVVTGPSVFFRLGELRPGDRVTVHRADGRAAVFTVNAVRRYPKDDFPTRAVYGRLDHAGLRLVTCGGSFDAASGHYLDDIVVFAHLTGTTQSARG